MRIIFFRFLIWVVGAVSGVVLFCTGAFGASGGKSEFSIILSVSKKTCYVREEIDLDLEIKSSLMSIDIGFSRYELNLPGTFLEEVLPVEKTPGMAVIRRRIVPLTSGTFALGPAKIFSAIIMPGVGGEGAVRRATLVSNALNVRVLPLPETGDSRSLYCPVGEYEFSVKPDKKSAQVGEVILIAYEVSGKGPMRTFTLPRVKASEDFSVSSILGQKVTVDSATGRKRMVYMQEFVPLNPDIFEIPAVEFVSFNLVSREYVSSKHGPFALDIKSSLRSDESPDEDDALTGFEYEGRFPDGLRGLKHKLGSIRSETVRTIFAVKFWCIQAIPLVAIILSAMYVAYRQRLESVEMHNYSKAYPRAKKELKRVKRILKLGDVEGCFMMLPKIIRGYVGAKLNVSAGGMTNYEIVRHVRDHTRRKRFILQIETLLGMINRWQYTEEELDARKVKKWLKTTEKVIHWMEWHRIFRRVEREYRRALSEEGT